MEQRGPLEIGCSLPGMIRFVKNKETGGSNNSNKGELLRKGVKNGSLGTVIALKAQRMQVTLDAGRTVQFNPQVYNFFTHGYVMTIHKSEGQTVDRSFVLLEPHMNANTTLVAMTRHREGVKAYMADTDFVDLKSFVDHAGRSEYRDHVQDYSIRPENKPFFENVQNYMNTSVVRTDLLERIAELPEKALQTKALWKEYHLLNDQLRTLATTMVENKTSHQLYLHQAGLRWDYVEVHAGAPFIQSGAKSQKMCGSVHEMQPTRERSLERDCSRITRACLSRTSKICSL